MAIGALLLGIGWFGLRAFHANRLNALFDGPTKQETEVVSGFYPTIEYILDKAPVEEAAVDEMKSESPLDRPSVDLEKSRMIEGGHYQWRLDAVSGATKMARLRSPSSYRAPRLPQALTITYPPQDALFPPNLCAPWIEWADAHNDFWQVTLSVPFHADPAKTWSYHDTTDRRRWRIPEEVWRQLRTKAARGDLSAEASAQAGVTVTVKGVKRTGLYSREDGPVQVASAVSFRFSADPADDYIVYRLVSPPFINMKTPALYVRDIRERMPRLFLDAREQYCVNCHTFSSKDPRSGRMSLQVRYVAEPPQAFRGQSPTAVKQGDSPRVYLTVFDIDRQEGGKRILPFEVQMSTYMAWSPDGRYLALAANQIFGGRDGPTVFETQSVAQPMSDLGVLDFETGTALLVPGASDPNVLETYPCWTPDGKALVYSSVQKGQHSSVNQFDLRIVDWSDGKGGTPRPVPGASNNGKSNFYARFSPDGKWMSWTKSDYGALIKSSSDIWLTSANFDKPPVPLASNCPWAADSWHSWSSNSKWIVFVSKRENGVLARLYLTHIDENGVASPPVRLSIEDPDILMCFNIPESVATIPRIEDQQLYDNINIHAREFDIKPAPPEGNAGTP